MKNIIQTSLISSLQIRRQHLQLLLMILTLITLVLGAGAPISGGGTTPGTGG